MGRVMKTYLSGSDVYSCAKCKTHLTKRDDLISTAFQGKTGRAYLFNRVVNATKGPNEDRNLTTGLHTIRNLYCSTCDCAIGWYYTKAFEPTQQYKEGKYIVEKALMTKVSPASDTDEDDDD